MAGCRNSSCRFHLCPQKELAKLKFNEVKDKLGLPIFVKPANAGSSVGVHKVHNLLEFDSAVSDAFQYDKKFL